MVRQTLSLLAEAAAASNWPSAQPPRTAVQVLSAVAERVSDSYSVPMAPQTVAVVHFRSLVAVGGVDSNASSPHGAVSAAHCRSLDELGKAVWYWTSPSHTVHSKHRSPPTCACTGSVWLAKANQYSNHSHIHSKPRSDFASQQLFTHTDKSMRSNHLASVVADLFAVGI
jgi:hypothetical protein